MGLSSSSTFQLATVGLHSTSHIGLELWSTYQLATVGLHSINYYALVSQSHCRLADNLLAKWLKQFFYIDWLTFVCMQSSIFGSISQIALKHNLWKWMHFKILQSFCVDYFIITFRIQKMINGNLCHGLGYIVNHFAQAGHWHLVHYLAILHHPVGQSIFSLFPICGLTIGGWWIKPSGFHS